MLLNIVARCETHKFCILQHVRRAAVLALNTDAHNKPNLIKALLPELLALLYGQTDVKVIFHVSSLFCLEDVLDWWICDNIITNCHLRMLLLSI
jgi:hypothetical protein